MGMKDLCMTNVTLSFNLLLTMIETAQMCSHDAASEREGRDGFVIELQEMAHSGDVDEDDMPALNLLLSYYAEGRGIKRAIERVEQADFIHAANVTIDTLTDRLNEIVRKLEKRERRMVPAVPVRKHAPRKAK